MVKNNTKIKDEWNGPKMMLLVDATKTVNYLNACAGSLPSPKSNPQYPSGFSIST
jgi:hypothetical protein